MEHFEHAASGGYDERPTRSVGAFVGRRVALGALSALTACGPLASFRPASGLMTDRDLEVGAGWATVSPRPYVNEDWASAGQLWVSGETSRTVALSGIAAFDSDALALGGALGLKAVRAERLALGVDAELGYAWGALSLPVAARLFDETWLYAAPRLGTWGSELSYGTPVGASVRVVDGAMLRAEWQRSWQDFKYYNRRDHLGIALAYQL